MLATRRGRGRVVARPRRGLRRAEAASAGLGEPVPRVRSRHDDAASRRVGRPLVRGCTSEAPAASRAPPSPPQPPRRRSRTRPHRRGCRRRGCRDGRRARVVLRSGVAPPGADRPEHVRLRRRRIAARRHPGRAESATGSAHAHQSVGAEGDGRHRGPTVLRARRTGRRGHRPRAVGQRQGTRGRAGRLDDHAAARPEPLHLSRAHARAEGQGGVPRGQAQPRVAEGADPRHVPEPGLLRQPRVRHRGGGADLLQQAGPIAEPAPRRRCWRA